METKDKTAGYEDRKISFGKLFFSSILDILFFQVVAGLILAIPAAFLMWLMNFIASSTGTAVTTANLKDFILSWRFPVILLIGFILIALFIIVEIFAQIHMCDDILEGRPVRVLDELKKSLHSFGLFLNPSGIGLMAFIFFLVPLCGIGFSISLSDSIYIPRFIMNFIMQKPLLAVGFIVMLVAVVVVTIRGIFTLHAVRLDGIHPKEAKKQSIALVKGNKKDFFLGMLKAILLSFLLLSVIYLVFLRLPEFILSRVAQGLPIGHIVGDPLSDIDRKVMAFRVACVVCLVLGSFLWGTASLLAGTYLIFKLTDYYRKYVKGPQESYKARPKQGFRVPKIVFLLLVFGLIAAGSAFVGQHFEEIIKRNETVGVIAHRAGGTMAAENTVLGVEKAVEHGCIGSEIDIQRTKDGYYVVNHDKDFGRLTGVAEAPKDMTLEEIRKLKIKDANTDGEGEPVATLEEMLDVVKGTGTKLLIEMKGETADRQMVDDTIDMVREKNCMEDVMLISLRYDLIDYAETKCPELDTGVLVFAGLGNFAKLNCDVLILEEEMASNANARELRRAGKGMIVWTVNTEESMLRFLDSRINAIITDNIEQADRVQQELDQRNDLEITNDWVSANLNI